ncbi:MAG: small, acid-soluble spore protein, alpha/beta type [Clostridiales bacterium]|nr:small, acid-soluble spore protein, alpha/beta type [Clostridiales bacterium]
MSRRGIMSEALKKEIARKMGVDDLVARDGWGAVSSRNCGRVVQVAIGMAEDSLSKQAL